MYDIDDNPRHWVEASILNEWHHDKGDRNNAWRQYDEFGWNLTLDQARDMLDHLEEGAVVHVLVKPRIQQQREEHNEQEE